MKKTFGTLAIILIAAFSLSSGCSDETEDLLIGTWQETEVIYQETINDVVCEPIQMLEPGDVSLFTFNKDNTYTSSLTSEDIEESSESTGTWSLKDNVLTIMPDEDFLEMGPQIYDISEIDENHLNMSMTEETTEQGNTYSVTISIKMKKIK